MDSVINQPTLTTYPDGSQAWYLHDQLHREDGPAIIRPDGLQYWYLHGQLHREDGPAVIYPDGSQYWYLHGQLHREDGPAIINPDGYQAWYLHDVQVSAEEVFSKMTKEQKMKAIFNLDEWR